MYFLLLSIVSSIKVTKIPESGNPPTRLSGSSAVYDPILNRIITFGGFEYSSLEKISAIFTFNLNFLEWDEIKPQSTFIPDGHSSSYLYLRPDRTLLIFFGLTSSGISSEVYSFNLNTRKWKSEELTGDSILGRDHPGFTSFTYLSINYIAFFGGQTSMGIEDSLYTINTQTLEVRKMPQNNNFPSKKISASLCFWKNHLLLYGYYPESLDITTYKEVWKYSLETEEWEMLNIKGQKPIQRFFHTACVYLDYMFIFFGYKVDPPIDSFKDIWRLDLNELSWIQVGKDIKNTRFESGNVLINSTFYFVYGRDEYTLFNSILMFDLGQEDLRGELLVNNWDSPIKRISHCSFRVGVFMYVFGGMSEIGVYLNDMWKFDLENNYWSAVIMQGNVPSPRASFSCTQPNGQFFIIYGGKDDKNIFSDMYAFRTDTNFWIELTAITVTPAPRYNACIVYDNFKIYIIGGQNAQGSFKEIWYYDYIESTYGYVTKSLSFSLIKHNCWAVKEGESSILNVVGGSSFEEFPNFFWYQIEVLEDFFNVSVKMSSDYFYYTDNALVVSKDYFYIIYGSVMSRYMKSDICKVHLITGEVEILKLPIDSGAYGHSACHWKNSIYVFGGGKSLDAFRLENSITNNFFKIENSDNSIDIECSISTIGKNCTPCIPGEYYYNKQCIPCPKGKFSSVIAAFGEEQCIPCPAGTYSNKIGADYCLECPYEFYCPLGSINPKVLLNNLEKQEIHPGNYKRKTNYISGVVNKLVCFAIVACFGIGIITMTFKRVWNKLECLDLFAKKHRQELEVPVVYRRTSLGGLFSVFFVLISFFLLTGSFLTYFLDNIIEMKSLMPSITLDIDIKSSLFTIETNFYIYGGDCTTNSKCHSKISVFPSGISYKTMIMTCNKIEEDTCQVIINFSNFSIDSTLSSITLSFKEKSSYTSFFTVNFTSSSSIPDSFSSVFIPVNSPSSKFVFKGNSPTLVYLRLIPSLFTSESSEWKNLDTGYHLQIDEDPKIGSLTSQNGINFEMYLYVQIILVKSETGLNTQRIINNNWYVSVGGILGTIFGLMNFVSVFMNIFEGIKESYNKKIRKKVSDKRILQRIKVFRSEFGYDRDKGKRIKVAPIDILTE
ncbi:hypothetical protein SteCoe_2523 [Stentor coeruleus]|uniref:Tyrosine-protein kinase ephrin type A/B receptor-like domain-containing protein n=1 Tax=Stentor coeruleus TaxID=5963 RepID=A0A1R2CZB4_9CILI|nr:hypothetical protein SteCoe_2523 [Stentor coeruleus]